jgi:uncharacterized protein (DUF2384 family)
MRTPATVKNGVIELLEPRVLKEGAQLFVEDVGAPMIEDRPLKTKKQVIEFALEIFRNNKKVVRSWLSSPNGALDNAMPIDLLDTPEGIEAVGDVLGRMATGVYS